MVFLAFPRATQELQFEGHYEFGCILLFIIVLNLYENIFDIDGFSNERGKDKNKEMA